MRLALVLSLLAAPLAAQIPAADTGLLQSPAAQAVLGEWQGAAPARAFCLAHYHDYGAVFVIDSLTPADQTAPAWCAIGQPLLIDAPTCPKHALAAGPYLFIIVRCEAGAWRRFNRRLERAGETQ